MNNLHKFRVGLLALFLVCTLGFVSAIDVDVAELETSVNDTVNFINYTGPYDVINTVEEIRGIGISLSAEIPSGESRVFAGKYKITHILPSPDSPLKGADILELLPSARVDHIDNLRRIISAYLENRYGYSAEDARLLGVLVTVYNAVHRGNLDRFAAAYVPEVTALLKPETAGLSLNWAEWAGKSQIVIPLASDAAPGELSSVPADELIDKAVEETLSDTQDQGIEQRQAAADLIDRTVDEETTQVQQQQDQIDQQQQQLDQQAEENQQQIDQLQEQIAALPDDSQQKQDLQLQLEEQQQTEQDIQQQQEQIDQQQAQTDQRQEAAAAADQRSREVREEVAQDVAAASTQPEVASNPVRFIRSRISGDRLFSTMVIVDTVDGSVLTTAEREIVGRSYTSTRQGIVAISEESGTPTLVLLSSTDLTFISAASAEVSPYSPIVIGTGDDIYAVIKDSGEWYAGRFDANLNLLFRSSIPVDEGSDLQIEGNSLLVQRKDGRFTTLALDELKVGQ